MTLTPPLAIPSNEELTTALKRCLEADLGPKRPEWTDHVCRTLQALCPEGCKPYGTQWSSEDRGEYLCDQVWAIEGHDWESYAGLSLVMECEWDGSRDANLDDFSKVIDVFADRRIFIGSVPTTRWGDRDAMVETMVEMVSLSRCVRDDQAVIVALCEKGGSEDYKVWWIDGLGGVQAQ